MINECDTKVVKLSALKGIIKRHEEKCHRKYGMSWRAESILRRILETFCVQELSGNRLLLINGWYDFLRKKSIPGNFIGQLCCRKFKCLERVDGNP